MVRSCGSVARDRSYNTIPSRLRIRKSDFITDEAVHSRSHVDITQQIQTRNEVP